MGYPLQSVGSITLYFLVGAAPLYTIPFMSRILLHHIFLVAVAGVFLLLGGCSDEVVVDAHDGWTAEQFFTEARRLMQDGSYEKAAKTYEKLESRFPFGKYATQAQLDVAYCYYKNDEPDAAIAAADRFIKLNPTHPYVDYPYYLKGLVNYNRGIGFFDRFIPTDASQRDAGATQDSYKDFDELVKRFPNSRYAEDSRKRMIALRNSLAMHEIHVADYYMRRGAYLAAARRCAEVLKKYQKTQAVPVALEIMEKAYRTLGMVQLAEDVHRVFELNYANGIPGKAAEDVNYEPSTAEKIWRFIGLEEG